MPHTPINELPRYWQKQIKDLRAENARYRIEARELRNRTIRQFGEYAN